MINQCRDCGSISVVAVANAPFCKDCFPSAVVEFLNKANDALMSANISRKKNLSRIHSLIEELEAIEVEVSFLKKFDKDLHVYDHTRI